MGRIKSALELALERTEDVVGDRRSLETAEAKRRGKKLAGEYLEEPGAHPIEAALKQEAADTRDAFRQGVFEVFISRVSLPSNERDIGKFAALGSGLQALAGDPRISAIFRQLEAAAKSYLDETAQYEDAIMRQYAPQLKQKEAELSRRMGQQVRIDPFQDPEFIAFYKKNMDALKANYEAVIADARAQISACFPGALTDD
jgi:hypothetical protein